ncbi:hypothetical protein [Chryseobacterium lactis]|uniref:hypothetical protein n=1 Tax=Chryseobacterium lactis TaxID=1241981 RepID=UPI0013DDE09E|nr:hypothetical protein [Chryseobacterium lactis]
MIERCTGFGILNMSRMNTDEAHSSTGSAEKRALLLFPDNNGSKGTYAVQLLMECILN